MNETDKKIMNATMSLVMEKGYSSTTTKDIAKRAGVNECTIFRRFKEKKNIVLSAMKEEEWKPDLKESDFLECSWDLKTDLKRFAEIYFEKVTPRFVKISIGLRSPDLYPETAEGIMQIPQTFKKILKAYFEEMKRKGKMLPKDSEALAMMFLSMCFGFVFMKASFEEKLTSLEIDQYSEQSAAFFVKGIEK